MDDLKPARDDLVIWFLETFKLLESSRQPQGTIPLSELFMFSDYIDLMCPLDQFLRTIVLMDETVLKHNDMLRKKHERRHSNKRRTR